MKICTECVFPPIPDRSSDYCAYDADTYEGDSRDVVGWGATEQRAIDDLKQQMEDA